MASRTLWTLRGNSGTGFDALAGASGIYPGIILAMARLFVPIFELPLPAVRDHQDDSLAFPVVTMIRYPFFSRQYAAAGDAETASLSRARTAAWHCSGR